MKDVNIAKIPFFETGTQSIKRGEDLNQDFINTNPRGRGQICSAVGKSNMIFLFNSDFIDF